MKQNFTRAWVTVFQNCDLFTMQPALVARMIAGMIGVEVGGVMRVLRQMMLKKNNCNRQSALNKRNTLLH